MAVTADVESPARADRPGVLGTHELVLLHGQPGSPADWVRVAGRLPDQFHAIAADRPGYGASQRAAGGFAANARAALDDLRHDADTHLDRPRTGFDTLIADESRLRSRRTASRRRRRRRAAAADG